MIATTPMSGPGCRETTLCSDTWLIRLLDERNQVFILSHMCCDPPPPPPVKLLVDTNSEVIFAGLLDKCAKWQKHR